MFHCLGLEQSDCKASSLTMALDRLCHKDPQMPHFPPNSLGSHLHLLSASFIQVIIRFYGGTLWIMGSIFCVCRTPGKPLLAPRPAPPPLIFPQNVGAPQEPTFGPPLPPRPWQAGAWPQASYLNPLGLSFLICEAGIMVPSSVDCSEEWIAQNSAAFGRCLIDVSSRPPVSM